MLDKGGNLVALDRWWFGADQNSTLLELRLEGGLLDIIGGKA